MLVVILEGHAGIHGDGYAGCRTVRRLQGSSDRVPHHGTVISAYVIFKSSPGVLSSKDAGAAM
jgi:hypothetical protein